MIRSMTGYARSERTGEWGRLVWEMRSVNHRYLELQFRMPDEFRTLDADLRQRADQICSRGKIEANLRWQADSAEASVPLRLDTARLDQVVQMLDEVHMRHPGLMACDAMRLLSYPGVVRQEAPSAESMLGAALSLFEDVLQDFAGTREREGAKLAEFINTRASQLLELSLKTAERAALVRQQWPERLRAKVEELRATVEPARFEQEVVLALQRLDVDEELSRLRTHVDEIRRVLKRKDPVGRRLDFLMQELNREANTLSSKSQDAEMTLCAVDMKVLIEQMREQVQNIE